MNNKLKVLLFTISIVMLGGCSKLQDSKLQQESNVQTQEGVKTTAPDSAVDKQTGEVDQQKFEKSQEVSESNDLSNIETELDSTVILEEDFSDL